MSGEPAVELPPLRGLRPDTGGGVTVKPLPRRQAALETNLARKGVWQVGPLQLALPLNGRDTLGLLRVSGPPLSLLDLDTFAWLTERWREGTRDAQGLVPFTLYDLGFDLYGREPSGKERRLMRSSLRRLQGALFELEGYDATAAQMGRLDEPSEGGRMRLLGSVKWSRRDPREPHEAFLDGWIVKQLQAGHLTYLDWRVLRSLDGVAKRLWVYLESQSFKRSGIGEGSVRLWLGDPMFRALGMNYSHAPAARRALSRAAEQISAADRSFVGFELHRPARRGGTWALLARRRLLATR